MNLRRKIRKVWADGIGSTQPDYADGKTNK
jgi:hypothetical protein